MKTFIPMLRIVVDVYCLCRNPGGVTDDQVSRNTSDAAYEFNRHHYTSVRRGLIRNGVYEGQIACIFGSDRTTSAYNTTYTYSYTYTYNNITFTKRITCTWNVGYSTSFRFSLHSQSEKRVGFSKFRTII